jgi:RNA-directed DNA polymerase
MPGAAPVNTGDPGPDLVYFEAERRVPEIQAKLHRWARDDSHRRFDDLFNLVCDPAFLLVAWVRVRGNKGSRTAGVDGRTAAHVLAVGPGVFLERLRSKLKDRSFRPLPVRERMIPKADGKKRRPGIATIAGRVVQASLKLVLEPVFEADFLPCSYGFRPERRTHDAVAEVHHFASRAYEWIVEGDIKACFDEISHPALMDRVRVRVGDKRVLALVKAFLKSGILTEDGQLKDTSAGTPQGPILSPLLCNACLHRLDRAWRAGEHGVLVRYADDVIVMCDTREQAKAALARLTVLLAGLGLEPKAAKTRIVHLAEGNPGLDFLGFHHRLVRGWTPKSAHLTFLARWPSRKAAQHARDRIREITGRERLLVPAEVAVTELNMFLHGWARYFRYGNSARVLGQVGNYALWRLGLWLSKKGSRRHGWRLGVTQVLLSPDHLGLASLHRTVIPPRPFRDWRGKAEHRR